MMMLRQCAAACLLLAAPVAAKQDTPRENLDCAVWAAYQLGDAQDEGTESGLAIAMAWFIGLYEGQTGHDIDGALAQRVVQIDEDHVAALTDPCVNRFSKFGVRLGFISALLSEATN